MRVRPNRHRPCRQGRRHGRVRRVTTRCDRFRVVPHRVHHPTLQGCRRAMPYRPSRVALMFRDQNISTRRCRAPRRYAHRRLRHRAPCDPCQGSPPRGCHRARQVDFRDLLSRPSQVGRSHHSPNTSVSGYRAVHRCANRPRSPRSPCGHCQGAPRRVRRPFRLHRCRCRLRLRCPTDRWHQAPNTPPPRCRAARRCAAHRR